MCSIAELAAANKPPGPSALPPWTQCFPTQVPYWTVRNSWGASFGMDGYFEIIRGYNKCGLSDCASFPRPA